MHKPGFLVMYLVLFQPERWTTFHIIITQPLMKSILRLKQMKLFPLYTGFLPMRVGQCRLLYDRSFEIGIVSWSDALPGIHPSLSTRLGGRAHLRNSVSVPSLSETVCTSNPYTKKANRRGGGVGGLYLGGFLLPSSGYLLGSVHLSHLFTHNLSRIRLTRREKWSDLGP